MKRRKFIKAGGKSALALWTVSLNVSVFTDDADAAEAFDLIIDGYSMFDGDYLGKAGELKATQIAAMQPLTLPYLQDSHGHKFDLTREDLVALLSNQVVEKETTVMLNHNHKVKIEPTKKANPSQQGLAVDLNSTEPNPVTPTEPVSPTTPSTPTGSTTTGGLADQHCTECHHSGSGAPYDLTKKVPAEVLEKVDIAVRGKTMPPGFRDRLSTEQLEKLLQELRSE